tara:strand:+ start:393 stop:989 length:597 start_codon:yes stop_codon:yes gene_type:complete
MANMKIKLVTGLAPLKTGATLAIGTNSTDATNGTITASTASSSSGDGSGGTFTLVTSGGALTSCTVVAGGDSYANGDTVTFGSSIVGGSTDVVFQITTADLDIDGDLGSQAIVPVDDIYCVIPAANGDTVSLEQLQVEHNRKWLLTLNGGGTGNYAAIASAVNNCVVAAQRDPLSMPVLGGDNFTLPDGVTISKVELS